MTSPLLPILLGATLVLGACSTATTVGPAATESPSGAPRPVEAAGQTPRLALSYDGGVLVLDATTGKLEADLPVAGFTRLNSAGDGRHVLVSESGGWGVLDTGTWSKAHGDHSHYYTATPVLHGVTVPGEEPGHVVVHDGLTSLFDDGTGTVTVVKASDWTDAAAAGKVTPVRTVGNPPHHGVAIADADGDLLVTTPDRLGAHLIDASGRQVAASADCPGVHGETVAATSILMVGCENGILAFRDATVTKVSSPDAYGRIGNAFGVDDSPLVLGDYKTDPKGGIGLTSFSLVDAEAATMRVVPSGSTYTWRGLARGAKGEALVLGTDGALRVFDPATGALVRTIPVIGSWTVPDAWQSAHPALTVVAGMAYVAEPATGTVHAVDYAGGSVWKSFPVPHPTIELVGVTG